MHTLALLVTFAILAVACSSSDESVAQNAGAISTQSPEVSSPADPSSTLERLTTTSAPQGDPTTTTPGDAFAQPPSDCTVLSDFTKDAEQRVWEVVNDDVMGGRSEGDLRLADGRMVFEGATNTNGGGFSSLRLSIELGALSGTRSIVIRAVSDGRSYMLTLDDRLEGRSRRVSHLADIGFPPPGQQSEPSVVTVPIEAFTPSVFGEPVEDVAVQIDLVDEIGLMINDGLDGPFRLDVEWVAGCP